MNRVLQFLGAPKCRHCVAERRYAALKALAEAIEDEGGGTFEFCVPSARRLAGEDFDPDEAASDPPAVQLFIAIESERVPVDTDLRQYAIDELLRIGNELIDAAERMEGGAPCKPPMT